MIEFLGSGVIGSLFGGLFRLAPELLKFLDKKEDRQHELAMLDKQREYELAKGSIVIEQKSIEYSTAQLEAISEAFQEQATTASKSYKFVAALSALVRPMVTYVMFGLYVCFKLTTMYYGLDSGVPWVTVVQQSWTPDDFAMLNATIMFWFVGRSITRK